MNYNSEDVQDCYDLLHSMIISDDPMLVGKIGATELNVMAHAKAGYIIDPTSDFGVQCENAAGLFPLNKETTMNFYTSMFSAIRNMDAISYWVGGKDKIFVEEELQHKIDNEIILRTLDVIHENPWTRSLEGMKVLVVNPFKASIEFQYGRKDMWDTHEWCPDFESLEVVQSKYSRKIRKDGFKTWTGEYNRLFTEIAEHDFDIALFGCGSFGLPLAGRVKTDLGKKAIHMGGSIQNLFGVRGERWENRDDYLSLMNKNWIRAFVSEIPDDVSKFSPIDGACYF